MKKYTGLKKIGIITLCICLSIVFYILSNTYQNNVEIGSPITLKIGETSLSINLLQDDNLSFELLEANTEAPISVSYNKSIPIELFINDKKLKSEDEIELLKIGKEIYLNLKIIIENNVWNYKIRTLPKDFPSIQLTEAPHLIGDFYGDLAATSQNQNYYIYKLDTDGELKYFKASPHILRNFKKWSIDSEIYYSYFEEYPEYNNVAMGGYSSGYYKVLNSNYNVIDTVGISKSDNLNIGTEYAEQHEFIMIAPGHYISTAYIIRNPNSSHCKGTLTPGTRVLAAYLQEVKNGAVIWEWISTDYPEFYDGYVESNNYENVDYMHSIDYFHLNSVFIDPSDNNIIMSARNQNAIIKIDRSDGHIIWILGGVNDQFGLSEEQKFSRQHFATYVENGNLLLFDNGFDKEISRVVELTLDESEKLVKDYTEYGLGIFGQYCGSVQKLSYDQAIYCIGWGYKLGSYALMSLVDFNNGQVLSELIGQSNELQSYRICFYP